MNFSGDQMTLPELLESIELNDNEMNIAEGAELANKAARMKIWDIFKSVEKELQMLADNR